MFTAAKSFQLLLFACIQTNIQYCTTEASTAALRTLEETSAVQMQPQLRQIFAIMCSLLHTTISFQGKI